MLLLMGALFNVPVEIGQWQFARAYCIAVCVLCVAVGIGFNRSKLRPVSILLPCILACAVSAWDVYQHGFCGAGWDWCMA